MFLRSGKLIAVLAAALPVAAAGSAALAEPDAALPAVTPSAEAQQVLRNAPSAPLIDLNPASFAQAKPLSPREAFVPAKPREAKPAPEPKPEPEPQPKPEPQPEAKPAPAPEPESAPEAPVEPPAPTFAERLPQTQLAIATLMAGLSLLVLTGVGLRLSR